MVFYLYQRSYSQAAIKAMVANPSDREAAARKLKEAQGGKQHHPFFAFGAYDLICVIDGPDDTFMLAASAAVGSAGTASSSSTVKLITAAHAVAAMTLAGKATGAQNPPHG